MSADLAPGRSDRLVSAEESSEVDALVARAERATSRWAVPPVLKLGATSWIWLGVAVALAGFVLIAVGWGQVAGETRVYRQLPYVVSAGFLGLSLVMVGLTVLNIATRHRDGTDSDRIADLAALLEELQRSFEEGDRR